MAKFVARNARRQERKKNNRSKPQTLGRPPSQTKGNDVKESCGYVYHSYRKQHEIRPPNESGSDDISKGTSKDDIRCRRYTAGGMMLEIPGKESADKTEILSENSEIYSRKEKM